MITDTPPFHHPRNPAPPFPIHFPGRRDRKLKIWLPDIPPQPGAHAAAAGMVRAAIYRRGDANKYTLKAQELRARGGASNERQAQGELIRAARAREVMRGCALWARVFAHHLKNDDPRLEFLAGREKERHVRFCRSQIWQDRWNLVEAKKEGASGDTATSARIALLLLRIAAAHDALNPHGFTLSQYCEAPLLPAEDVPVQVVHD